MTGGSLRQAMAWIHGWLGLLAGWLLFAMFLTGAASYFRPEITRWMQPEHHAVDVGAVRATETAVTHMLRVGPNDEQWFISLPDERNATTRVFARPRPDAPKSAARKGEIILDPATGEPLAARETRGGEHFYRFHFQLQLPHPWGRWLAGLCAMFMLGAIISGVITHKRIFADFFRLRWSKGQRSWLDAHNVSAVLALPFHAMITYTGLVTLIAMYMPWPIQANYAKPATYFTEAFPGVPEGEASGRAAPLTAVGPLAAAASREWDGGRPYRVIIRHPNDEAATITFVRSSAEALDARGSTITFSGVDGRRLSAAPPPGPALKTAGVMLGLHLGHFAGPALRWTYFLLGLAGAAMVGTGLALWTVKRRTGAAARPFFGLALVDRLNVAAVAALPAGMAAFLLANRLLPAGLAGRADIEVSAMFWAWGGLSLATLLRPVRRAWVEALAVSAAAFAAVPVVNALTTERGMLRSIMQGDLLFLSFDLAMMATAALLGFASWRIARKAVPGSRRQARGPRAVAAAPEEALARAA